MQVSVEKTGDLGRKLTITVPAADIEKKIEERLAVVAKQVKLDGFRPGKAPANLVRQRYADKITVEVQQDVISDTMVKAFDKEKLAPVGQPRVELADAKGKDFSYTISFEIMPEISPKKYSGLKLTTYTAKADKSHVEGVLENIRKAHRSYEDKKGAAANGDLVILSAEGFDKKGVALAGTKVDNHPLELGSGAFIPGFEEQLEGHKVGEKFDIDVTFPKEYHSKELAGKPVRFSVELHQVKATKLPELNDEFAKRFNVKSLAELRETIQKQVEEDIARAARQRLKRDLFDKLDAENRFPLPQVMVDSEFNAIWRGLMNDVQRSGATLADLDKSEDELRAEHRALAERRVRLGLLLAEIGKQEKVEVKPEEIKAEVERISSQFPAEQAEKAREYFNSRQGRQEIIGPLFENKVVDWIVENGSTSEKVIDADELLKEITG